MLKISPLIIYDCCNKLTSISESILENFDLLCNKSCNLYDKVRQYCNISDFESIYYEFDFQIQIWRNLLVEIETALGEPIEKIMKADYKEEYIEKKLFDYYVSLTNDSNDDNNYKKYLLNEICDFGLEDNNYDTRVKAALIKSRMPDDMLNAIISSTKNFDYKKIGYSNIEDVVDELVILCDKRGVSSNFSDLLEKISNKDTNYVFNPIETTKDTSYYSLLPSAYIPYNINSEIININGYDFDFAQVLPTDCTKLERIIYDYCKYEVINTMKTLPDNYLKVASSGDSNAIVLTSSIKYTNNFNELWGGYYTPSGKDANTIVILTPLYGVSSEYYTEDVVIHEMGHKFDDYSYASDEHYYYTEASNEWNKYYERYKEVLPPIVEGGYDPIPDTQEFFAETASAYFKNPDELKELCPEVYDDFHKMLGYEN